jgi:protoporphyrinogen oxidase
MVFFCNDELILKFFPYLFNFLFMDKKSTAIIIGAGPAGLTAGLELLEKTDILPIILESDAQVGGISKTINYKGNRMDLGGHRFFSKSDLIMNKWMDILPVQKCNSQTSLISYRQQSKLINNSTNKANYETEEKIMLIRKRLSRIYFLRKFFAYPISLSFNTLKNLGIIRVIRIFFSYLWIRLFPISKEKSLEDFFINRFGTELYRTFFRDFTEKVWGVKCSQISADWGAQRVKGLSVSKALAHAVRKTLFPKKGFKQKNIETTLIEQFLYPKYGPGQLWEEVADKIVSKGGKILLSTNVESVISDNYKIISVRVKNLITHETIEMKGEYFFSTMPIKDLITNWKGVEIPDNVKEVAKGLVYRDFITVGLLLNKLSLQNGKKSLDDNWIYIQEPDVKVGRLQFFNNWSPYLVKDKSKIWMGLEYFCNIGDELWSMDDDSFIEFAIDELEKINIIDKNDVLDSTIVRVPKTYPAYFGTYNRFMEIRDFTDGFKNLFLIGRNGMHKYNNQDHSMLTAIKAVELIVAGNSNKDELWDINTEQDYHEKK